MDTCAGSVQSAGYRKGIACKAVQFLFPISLCFNLRDGRGGPFLRLLFARELADFCSDLANFTDCPLSTHHVVYLCEGRDLHMLLPVPLAVCAGSEALTLAASCKMCKYVGAAVLALGSLPCPSMRSWSFAVMTGDVQGMLVSDEAARWDQVLGPEVSGVHCSGWTFPRLAEL